MLWTSDLYRLQLMHNFTNTYLQCSRDFEHCLIEQDLSVYFDISAATARRQFGLRIAAPHHTLSVWFLHHPTLTLSSLCMLSNTHIP